MIPIRLLSVLLVTVLLPLAGASGQVGSTGKLQVTARVVDTRYAWEGLELGRHAVVTWLRAGHTGTWEGLATTRISLVPTPRPGADRRRTLLVTIEYARN
ncbi:MAG TPA: hypothetical protein VNK43_10230 [Gemmatimonadales bacterium]|nr:hypothetical protein [Gemmatimonadales bacterium]